MGAPAASRALKKALFLREATAIHAVRINLLTAGGAGGWVATATGAGTGDSRQRLVLTSPKGQLQMDVLQFGDNHDQPE